MDRATDWILEHRDEVPAYIDKKQTFVTPTSTLWVLLSSVKFLMDPIYACLKLIQKNDTLLVEPNVQLKLLAFNVRALVGIFVVSGVDLILPADCGDVLAQ